MGVAFNDTGGGENKEEQKVLWYWRSNTRKNTRFAGFTDAWEQRKLSDEANDIIAGGDIDKNKATDHGKYPIFANALTNEGLIGYYNDYFRIKAPAVTATGIGEVGYAKARIVDFTPVVRLLSVKSKHDIFFLENAINIHKVIIESTGVPQLTVPQLGSYEIFFSKSFDEEQKIGNFFHTFDSAITLHQRKCDALIKVKKSMLQKMFPKNGKSKPEVRFAGFTDDWEQRKLSEEANDIIAGGDIDKNKASDHGKYPIFANALSNEGLIGYYNDYFRIKAAAVTVTGRGEVGYAKARIVDFTPVVRLLSVKSKHDIFFLENAINIHKVIIEST